MRRLGLFLLVCCACGDDAKSTVDATPPGDGTGQIDAQIDAPAGTTIKTIFVIPFENKSDAQIYGNTGDAPYINMLVGGIAAHATMFGDELPTLPSEPHYVWMEAGTNAFTDRTFTNDNDPSATNSTANTEHVVTTLEAAGVAWMSYQEDMTAGTCPIKSSGQYAAKHDPMVFFQDVVGSPPSETNAHCIAHHKPYSAFAADLASGGLSGYVFITPNLCNDMHGAITCPSSILSGPNIKAGDTWLSTELPRIIAYTQAHADAMIFLTWDEGDSSNVVPFLAIGDHVKDAHASTIAYTHSSMALTIQKLLGATPLPSLATTTDLSDMFDL